MLSMTEFVEFVRRKQAQDSSVRSEIFVENEPMSRKPRRGVILMPLLTEHQIDGVRFLQRYRPDGACCGSQTRAPSESASICVQGRVRCRLFLFANLFSNRF